MAEHVFYGRVGNETVIVPTEGASAALILFNGNHLTNPAQAFRALGPPFLRLFEAFSPVEIGETIANETGRDLTLQALKGKAPDAPVPVGPKGKKS